MSAWTLSSRLAVLALGALAVASCSRDLSTEASTATFPDSPGIFADAFASTVHFEAFGGSKLDALSIDTKAAHSGSNSLKVIVPNAGSTGGTYAGGAVVASVGRDLTKYNALTFWAKASGNVKLDIAGLGNDNTGTSKYTASASGLALTTTWQKYFIPIPSAAKLTAEKGMFFFAAGAVNGVGYELWFDDIQFETLQGITNPRPVMQGGTIVDEVGATIAIAGTAVTFAVSGTDQVVSAAPAYYTLTSSSAAVATIENGAVKLVGAGSATVTGTLGATPVVGTITVKSSAPPTAAATAPTKAAADVVALFSAAYTPNTVDTWSASWDVADVADVTVASRSVKKYTNLSYAGIEFITKQVNAASMSFLHLDVWVLDATNFKVKLVDFGANGAFGGGDDSEHEITLTGTSTPSVTTGAWNSIDIPLSAFSGLAARGHLAQMIISGSSRTVYLDNVYFYKVPAPSAPPIAAPTPTRPAANVISLTGGTYTNVAVDTWLTSWSNANQTDVTMFGHTIRKYTNLVFAGIEMTSRTINASSMTGFHMDIWTPDATTAPAAFKVKLVDFGANGVWSGGDDVEHELTFTASTTPALATGNWVSIDVPLSAFAGLRTKGAIAQLIISGDVKTVYVDNVYFYASALTAPTTAPANASYPAANVISLSTANYTNVPVDTWLTGWSSASQADVTVGGHTLRRYTNLVFAGIETVARQIDASGMTHFRMDFWTPDATTAPAVFKVKLVDFGANGAFAGGDDVEHEVTLTATSTPSIASGSWVTLDIPLASFTGLTTKAHIAQLIISGDLKTVFLDNVLFHK